MSFLRKLLGKDVDGLLREAGEKEKAGDIGGAVLDYERALEQMEESAKRPNEIDRLRGRIAGLRDGLADKYVDEAAAQEMDGDLEGALQSLRLALDVSGSEEKRSKLDIKVEDVQRKLADDQISAPEEDLTEDEVYQALSGSWSEWQLDEFDEYGEPFKRAFLAFHAGRFDEAIAAYKELLEQAGDDALYLRLEHARALHLKAHVLVEKDGEDGEESKEQAAKLREEAIEVIKSFRKMLPKRRTPEARAQAWSLTARIYMDMDDMDSAEDALVQAQEIVPNEPAVYLNLGRFLSSRDRTEDAIAALEQGEGLMDQRHPIVELLLLLAMVLRKAGRPKESIERLEAINNFYAAMGRLEWDPVVAVPLAQMYEETGDIVRACDAYRNLSTGGDRDNIALYNYHAARLLKEQGRKAEIRPYMLRAREHAKDDDLKKKIDDLES